jgi:signal peptidase I
MEPTLPVGIHLICDKVTLRFRAPRRSDIVIFHSPTGEDLDLSKRVIALPGETVELREKKVFINGQELSEPYTVHKRAGERLIGDDLGPLTVPTESIFVLGDNRDESEDSTTWKDAAGNPIYFIKIADLKGLVRGIY